MYHIGESIDIKTKVKSGKALLTDKGLIVEGPTPLSIDFSSMTSVEMFRLHNTGRMLKIVSASGTLFLSVVRFNLFGYFAMINFFRTGTLFEMLKKGSTQPGGAANSAK
jgi:hypothetical protein